ncbi:hypothetical protein B0H19DRAFT_1271312 [Mycena capillaripes]|nr:hypothetical protein B0H19DRAFT_1271312 [Mycena capillaripes]
MFPRFLLLTLFRLARAVTLSLPDKFNSGTAVTVQWTRDTTDPISFGLMQRSLQGNQPILSVTPVPNEGGAKTGTTSVVFNTAGQVLLAVISQSSLSSGEKPNQLSAGKQLTVIPSNAVVVIPSPPSSSTDRTTIASTTTSRSQPPVTVVSSLSIHATSPSPISNPSISTAIPPTSSAGPSFSLSVPSQGSAQASSSSFFFSSTTTQSVVSTPSFPASTSIPSVVSTSHAGKSGPPRGTVIALAVIFPLLFLALILFCIIRSQRTNTRHRIDQFTDIWTRARRASERATISSFGGNDLEAGWAAGDQPPVSNLFPGVEGQTRGNNLAIPVPVLRRQQKLQLMVEQLTERNAALEREVGSMASASVMPPAHIFNGRADEPPPMYAESPESSVPPRMIKR